MKHTNALSHFLLRHLHNYTQIKSIYFFYYSVIKTGSKPNIIDNCIEPGFLGCTPVIHSLITY